MPEFVSARPEKSVNLVRDEYSANHWLNQSVENAGVAFVKGAGKRNKFF